VAIEAVRVGRNFRADSPAVGHVLTARDVHDGDKKTNFVEALGF
jgi:hypothetical protein